jgi:hypothetical protein
MDADGQGHPEEDSWVIACYATEDDDEPLGAGVVIDERRALTCAHVTEAAGDIWVAFPKAGEGSSFRRVRVARVVVPADRAKVQDLAVLYLSEQVPAGVIPAPLRCPKPRDLVSKWWWAFGFPNQDSIGSLAEGQVGAVLGYGWIRLDTGSSYLVEQGFSGSGLWSPDYQAVVAVVGQAFGGRDNVHKGDGRAITLQQADEWFPGEKIRALTEQWSAAEAGEAALAAWNWSLADDREGTRHWRPRARGVSVDSDSGFRFRGRVQALRKIKDWLDRDQSDRRVLVVTGSPGVGKSAVLGRIVTTADADAAKQLPASDAEAQATIGSVGCAVHAKGKTALEVAAEIARAASAALPERIEDFAPAIRDALTGRRRRFNVIVDAVDEAVSPAEARAVIGKVLVPLAETCADVGAQVVAGSRRADGDGNLLDTFGGAASTVDLDDAEFFDEDDLAAYALAALQLTGAERAGNPYADDEIATPVAARIAELSERNFLVAGLIARSHGLRDDTAVHPAALSFSPKVDDAFHRWWGSRPVVRGRFPRRSC